MGIICEGMSLDQTNTIVFFVTVGVVIVGVFLFIFITVHRDVKKGELYAIGEIVEDDALDEALEKLDPDDPQTEVLRIIAQRTRGSYTPEFIYRFRAQPDKMKEIMEAVREANKDDKKKSVATVLGEMGVEFTTERN